MSAPSDDEWPEGLTEDGDKLFLNDKLLVPENLVKALIEHWHNAQLMHPGRHKMQRDLEWRFEFPPQDYAILNCDCNDCAVFRATKSLNHSIGGTRVTWQSPRHPYVQLPWTCLPCPRSRLRGKKMIVLFPPWTDIAGILWRFRVRGPSRRTKKISMEWASKPRPSPKP